MAVKLNKARFLIGLKKFDQKSTFKAVIRTLKHCEKADALFVKMSERNLLHHSNGSKRIMAIRNGETMPLFDTVLDGPLSPSPSLLIEKHEVRATDWQTVLIPDQVITFYLRRCTVEYGSATGDCYHLTRARGSAVIEKRAYEHRFRWDSPTSALAVRLCDAVLEQAAETVPKESTRASVDCAVQDTRLTSLLHALERERIHGYPAGRLFIDGMEQALAAILVHYDGIARRTPQIYKGGLTPYRMKRVNEFIREHIEETITLDDLAKEVGLSVSHFYSLFRKTLGTTPHQFVLQCRIQHAKSLLMQSSNSILEVALASGFRTHQHFSRIFHQMVGVSPSTYRSRL